MNTDENDDERDDLWDLLGKAKPAQASPFFSRNVLRAIREEQKTPTSVFAWLRHKWSLAALASATVAIAAIGITGFVQHAEHRDSVNLLAHQVTASPDYQVINHLDELLDSERNSVWLDASAY